MNRLVPKSRGGSLWRFALAALVVIGFTAATTAVAGLLKVKDIENAFNQSPSIKSADVTLPAPGQPQTLLLIGSDHRAADGGNYTDSNTDTMMLVRIDDSSSTINLLSIPRDLEVNLPGANGGLVPQKLNAAYSIGGPNLLIKTLQQQVFPGLQVNHIFDVNFAGFSDLVDAIGCVYTDVDHRYYNQTQLGADNYSSINIQPGYQKLCGHNQADTGALAFVRFRHTDTDIVRNARQQDFIRWARDQFSLSQLVNQEQRLVDIFGKHVETDHNVHTIDGLINLFDVIVRGGSTLKSIPFPAQLQSCNAGGQTPCFVTATPTAMQNAYRKFMTPTQASAATASSHKGKSNPHKARTAGLVADVSDAKNQALAVGKLGFPIYYPKLMLAPTDDWQPEYCSSDTGNCDNPDEPAAAYDGAYPRAYEIHGPHGGVYPSYRITVVLNSALGEYYGVQGTTWLHPPIFNGTSSTENVNGKLLQVFENGGKISLVAYRTPQGVYWISNTLDNSIGNSQMIGIAASFTRAP